MTRSLGQVALIAALALALGLVLGCVEDTPVSTATPTPTQAPTPTSTPIPTPTPTPTPGSAAVAGKSITLEEVKDLMAVVPARYEAVLFTDVSFMLQDPGLREALEEQGVLTALGPAAGAIEGLVSAVALAVTDEGLLGIFRTLVDSSNIIASLGILLIGVEPEAYGPFEVWEANVDLPFVKLSLGLSVLDESTAVFATSSSPDDVSAGAGVKAALDAAQGTDPGFLSDPGIAQLLEEVPPGFAMLVARNCASLPLEDIEGCTGLAFSATNRVSAKWVYNTSALDVAPRSASSPYGRGLR